MLNRDGKIQVKPGYDGVYGKAIIGGKEVSVDGEDSKLIIEDNGKCMKASSDLNKSEKSRFAAEAVNVRIKTRDKQKKLF